MSRLIDADVLKERLQNLAYDDWNQGVGTTWANAFEECADLVDEQPTIEPERCQLTDDDKEVIRIHLNAFKEKLCNQYRWNEAKEYEELIDRLMNVQPARKTGKWIEKSERLAPLNTIWWDECSVCGHHAFNRMTTDFCPNCGALMEG